MLKDKRIKIITGHYGSGKTEFAINYALRLSENGKKVAIADLDVVNPYFRSREYEKIFQEKNIELLGFILKEHGMDLPSVSGNIMKPFMDTTYEYIIDLGGNSAGAKAFASFRKLFSPLECDLFFVLNANRPETSDLESCLVHLRNIEGTLNLKVTGIINNTHLIWETTEEDLLKGNSLALKLSHETGIPIRYTVCKRDLIPTLQAKFEGSIFPIDMLMRKNWM